ncbi:MAG TPA: hypothetical protein VMV37_13380 [Gammaproteobacteria bacterium]|nr:hypothetical protein [Gammaproteobacteria bacterium]
MAQTLIDLGPLVARADGRRSKLHDPLDGRLGIVRRARVGAAKASDDDAVGGDDDAYRRFTDPPQHVDDLLVGPARRDAAVDECPDEQRSTLRRQVCGKPIHLPVGIVEHTNVSELLEPARGSRALVSLEVVAVDHDGAVTIELVRGALIEPTERNVDGSRDVCPLVFVMTEYFDQLRTMFGNELLHDVAFNGD